MTWQSKKQSVVARSSAEAEFRMTATRVSEVIWIKRLLEDLKIYVTLPLKLYCGNKSAIVIAHNSVLHDKTKHVEINKHFIKKKLDNGQICMPYLPAMEQVDDINNSTN